MLAAALAGGAAYRLRGRRRRTSFRGRTVLITGGSRGLGLVIARQLADEGAKLALLARDPETLERARRELEGRGADVLTVPCDVADRAQVEKAVDEVATRFGAIDVLVNDAGIIDVGPFEHMHADDLEESLAVHVLGPFHAVLAALPLLEQSELARVVNVSSIGGIVPMPHLLPYCASKFALVGLSRGLRAELARRGVTVTTVCPGLMRTGSPVNARFRSRHRREYAWFALADALPLLSIGAERAARRIIEAARSGRAELVLGLSGHLASLAVRLSPALVSDAMGLVDCFLLPRPRAPRSAAAAPERVWTGGESASKVAPSLATALSDRAAARNNELP